MNHLVILHVEDEADDALFVEMAFARTGRHWQVQRVNNGEQAIDYLAGNAPFEDRNRHPLPHLVLLDLKLPLQNGFDVLVWTRRQERFRGLPIIVLSGSSLEADRQRARELGATAYFVKTHRYEDVVECASSLMACALGSPAVVPPECGARLPLQG